MYNLRHCAPVIVLYVNLLLRYLFSDKYNNRFEHFLSIQIVPVFVQVQKPSLSRGKRLYMYRLKMALACTFKFKL